MNNAPWLANYDKPVPKSLAPYPNKTVFSLLEETAAKYPDHPCTLFKGRTISFREMNELTDRMAAALAGIGVKKGDRVGIFMPNSPQFVIAYYGILKAGGIVIATNPLYTPREMEHQLNDAGVETMVVMSNFYNRVKEVQPKTKIKRLIVTNIKEQLPPVLALLFTLVKEKKEGHRVDLAPGDMWMKDLLAKYSAADRPKLNLTGDDIALFQYSGGTTGISKGAIALHRNLVANTLQMRAWFHPAREGQERTLMAIPLFHVYGMVAGMSLSVSLGATLIMVPNPRDIHDVLENISKYKPTLFPGVPAMYNAINNNPDVKAGKYDLSSVKYCISGSAPLLLETKTTFEKITGAKLFEGFGMSEAPTATHCNPLTGKNKEGSIGMPLPDVEAKIVSLEDGKTEMPIGQEGELIIRGPQVFKGYWNMPTETENALRDLGDGGGPWLFSGDIAKMDEDGYFYIVDRKKELIKPGGFQVWPREVEEVIIQHPKVLEVGVAGIPDAHSGEAVKAWVVLKPGETATAEEIRAFCKERLTGYKVPKEVEFRDALPRTPGVGKLLRRELVREHKEKLGIK
ncbi:MAG: long-chain fatty acid--CoA ligase [Anaerolineales bacterium]|nr:long-chain fatty acid--CoA ligase [Anaerolineales bacterium]